MVGVGTARGPEEIDLIRSISRRRPTTSGALVEVLVVLALSLVVVGVYRGWFANSLGSPTESSEPRSGSGEPRVGSEAFASRRGICDSAGNQ